MSAPPRVIDQNGRPIALDRALASGGEGFIYTLPSDPTLLAKIYRPEKQSAEQGTKLRALLALRNPNLLGVAAWPTGLLFDPRSKEIVGFVMPRMLDCHLIQQLYNPVQRLKCFPRAGWSFQVRAALNLSAAFEEVHKAGCLVGDVNESNALVSTQALVRLIDCDSFQVRAGGRQYLCELGKPQYTPPELQGKSLRGLTRTENHDRFGLAVLIYQLLFVGRHPYMGVYQGSGDPSFEQLITEYRFAQGPGAQTWGMAPPPHTPTFKDIPVELGGLFRRAFERGSDAGSRPTPTDWVGALGRLEKVLAECATDPGHTYWRGAGACVWCRLAEQGGPEYYFGVAGGGAAFALDETRLQDVMRRLAAVQAPDFPYNRDHFAPPAAPVPEPLPDGLDEHRSFQMVLLVAVAVCALLIPLGFVRGFLAAVGVFGAVVFGAWWAILWTRSPWHREHLRRKRDYHRACHAIADLEYRWEGIQQRYRGEFRDTRRAVERAVSDCRRLPAEYDDELRRLAGNAEAHARLRHLRLHSIADADIPKIGTGRKVSLALYGISTAADVTRHAIQGIKGFGEALTANLLDWRDAVERSFRFDPNAAVSPAEQRAFVVRYRSRQQQLLAGIEQRLTTLASFGPGCKAELQALVADLTEAVANYEQAYADLRAVKRKR